MTLVEALIVSVFFLIIIGAIYSVLRIGGSFSNTGITYIDVSADARLGIDRMIKELHGAKQNTIQISEDGNSIEFELPTDSDTIRYSLGETDSRQLVRIKGTTTTVLCNNVENIRFSPAPFSGNMIDIELQIQKSTTLKQNLFTTLKAHVKVRN